MSIQKAFLYRNRIETVRELEARFRELGEALEWADSGEEAASLLAESRIIAATLSAIKKEHARGYFDQVTAE